MKQSLRSQKQKDPKIKQPIVFDREAADRKKIRLAYWAACLAELSTVILDEGSYDKARNLSRGLEQQYPLTLDDHERRQMMMAAQVVFDAETRAESGYQHIDCLCRPKISPE